MRNELNFKKFEIQMEKNYNGVFEKKSLMFDVESERSE